MYKRMFKKISKYVREKKINCNPELWANFAWPSNHSHMISIEIPRGGPFFILFYIHISPLTAELFIGFKKSIVRLHKSYLIHLALIKLIKL